MIRLHYYLDTRAVPEGAEAPLKLAVSKRGTTAMLPTGVSLRPCEWDGKGQRITKHPRKASLESYLRGMRYKAEELLRPKIVDGTLAKMTAYDIRDQIAEMFSGKASGETLGVWWERTRNDASRSEGTREYFDSARKALIAHDERAMSRRTLDLTDKYVKGFYDWLREKYAHATANGYFYCFSAVINTASEGKDADYDIVKKVASANNTASKRKNLTAKQLHILFNHTPYTKNGERYLDLFKMSFYLRAANPKDISRMTVKDIYNGRVIFARSKTGNPYTIKIEPELQELIDKHSDGERLFADFKHYDKYKTLLTSACDYFARVCPKLGIPCVTANWMRHSWASLAFELEATMDLVSASLAHSLGGARVTSTYVHIQDTQIDELARKIYDLVNAEGEKDK